MNRYLIIIEETSTGYSAYSPDLPGCVATGTTRDSVEREMHDAITLIGSSEIVKTTEKEGQPAQAANANQPAQADKAGAAAPQPPSAAPQPPAAVDALKAVAQEKPPEVKTLGDLASAAPVVIALATVAAGIYLVNRRTS